jgi:crotonobetainyl-CoA:carnitine CoA-transferase CaiB-like acyl-CoA transferase
LLSGKGKRHSLLENVLVLDLADEQGSFCSKLLADLGATVLKVESPEEAPSKNCPASFYHNINKFGIALDPETREGKRLIRRLVEISDILVETLSPERISALELNPEQIRRINSHLIHLSITGFGRTGPKRKLQYNDTIAAASGGQMYVTRTASRQPAVLPFRQSFYTAALFGANAALLGLRKRRITGKGCHIDLSIQEAVASMLDPVMIEYFHGGQITGGRMDDRSRSFTVLPCMDGFILITISRNWETLLALMHSEGKAADLIEKKWQKEAYREKHRGHIMDVVEGWTKAHTKAELFELGQTMQFPWAPVVSPDEIMKSRQLRARRFFSTLSLPNDRKRIRVPGCPFKLSGISAAQPKRAAMSVKNSPEPLLTMKKMVGKFPGTHRLTFTGSATGSSILGGIRVVDLTRMLSGPYTTRILGDFGAEVIKVQCRKTATGAERNSTPYFRAWNRNKRSICLDLSRPEAREIFLELVAISDVVVENFAPRVMENWGLTYPRLRKIRPNLIMASISAMGQTGPWRDYVGFAPTFHALSGLMAVATRAADTPGEIGNSYGDVVAGLYAALAILSSIYDRDETGRGGCIDLSAYESLCTFLDPVSRGRISADPADCCGCYPCSGNDRWCVIHISNEKEWRAFCRVCGCPKLKSDRFSTLATAAGNRIELDGIIVRWTRQRKAEIIVRHLQDAGVPSAVVQNAEDLTHDIQLAARRFFINLGRNSFSDRSALWPWREKPANWKAAPGLGEDNRYVYRGLLGFSEAAYRELIAKGIIG